MVIAGLVLFDLSRPDQGRVKGIGIGLATGLKLTPAIFVVYLLVTRRYRAAAVSLAVFAGTVAAGFAAMPQAAAQFWGGAFADPGRVGRIENAANQTLRGAFARLLHTLDVQAVWLPSAAVVGIVGLALAARAGRRGDDAAGFCFCALTGLLISPVSWSHHWVLALPVLLLYAVRARHGRSSAGLAVTAGFAAIGFAQVIWWVPIGQHRHAELHLAGAQLLFANAYVLIALLALTWPLSSVRRGASRDQPFEGWRSEPGLNGLL
jgi:alpha-1,2-mannosyltransferase